MVVVQLNNLRKPFEVMSFSWAHDRFPSAASQGNGGTDPRSGGASFTFKMAVGQNSLKLMHAHASGFHIPGAFVSFYTRDRKKLLRKWELFHLMISSYRQIRQNVDEVSISYARSRLATGLL